MAFRPVGTHISGTTSPAFLSLPHIFPQKKLLPVSQKRYLHVLSIENHKEMEAETFQHEASRVRPHLLLIARRHVGSEEESEDIVQDCLLRMWTMRDQLSLPFEALAATITRNLCIDRIRSRPPVSPLKGMEADVPDTDEGHPERIERMMDIIRALPDMQQIILRLRHIEGMEMKEIAQLTGSTEVAVRKALSRARMAVKKQYMRRKEE